MSDEPDTRLPTAGETWGLIGHIEDPWPIKAPYKARIRDVKDGWVRYATAVGTWVESPDERMKLDTFLKCYGPIEAAVDRPAKTADPTPAE